MNPFHQRLDSIPPRQVGSPGRVKTEGVHLSWDNGSRSLWFPVAGTRIWPSWNPGAIVWMATRIAMVTKPGGSGKTRLVTQVRIEPPSSLGRGPAPGRRVPPVPDIDLGRAFAGHLTGSATIAVPWDHCQHCRSSRAAGTTGGTKSDCSYQRSLLRGRRCFG